jgi:hypothetical protein
MTGSRIPVTIWLGLAMLISGCVSSGNPAVMDQDRLAKIVLNVSTKEDVKRLLGQPNSMSQQSGNYFPVPGMPPTPGLTNVEVWSYSHLNV